MKQAIRAARLLDGIEPKLRLDHVVVIRDGQIAGIRPHAHAADGPETDLGDVTLLPGLIDTHLHLACDPASRPYFDPSEPLTNVLLRAVANAQALLRVGVTTACDCGGPNDVIFPVRDAIRRGALVGPRIVASGAPITVGGGHGVEIGARVANTRGELVTAVREQVAAGADFIKIMETGGGGDEPGRTYYSADDLRAAAAEAAREGRRIAAHAHGRAGIRACVEAGIPRIEHASFFGNDGAEFDEGVARDIVAREIIVTPTNAIDFRRRQRGGNGAPREILNRHWRALYQLGVRMTAGSDAGVTGMFFEDYALIPELLVQELGMTPFEAIQACTYTAAQALALEGEIGSLEVGKCADLVGVQGNPLEDVTALRRVCWVMREGRVVHVGAKHLHTTV